VLGVVFAGQGRCFFPDPLLGVSPEGVGGAMPIAALLRAEADIKAMKKDMGDMWMLIKQQQETIRELGVEQKNAVTQKDMMVVMVAKADHSSTERRLRELRSVVDSIIPAGSAGRTLSDMLAKKASSVEFANLEQRVVELRTHMETTAGEILGDWAAKMEPLISAKAGMEDVRCPFFWLNTVNHI
jgi:hypothetical protein